MTFTRVLDIFYHREKKSIFLNNELTVSYY